LAREKKFSITELYQHTKELLLQNGYEGFTFSLLADRLEVSRGTLYKYYDNKDELITDFMLVEMEQFLIELQEIRQYQGFEAQFNFLLDHIFKHDDIHQLIRMSLPISPNASKKAKENKVKLDKNHLDMYAYLQSFIDLGREENKLKPHIPDALILGLIFQTIAIPNHFGISSVDWIRYIKEILKNGMFTN